MNYITTTPDGFGRSALDKGVESTVMEHLPSGTCTAVSLMRWLTSITNPLEQIIYANAAIIIWTDLLQHGDERTGYISGEAWVPSWADYDKILGRLIRRAGGSVWTVPDDQTLALRQLTINIYGPTFFCAEGSHPVFIKS